MSFIKTVSSGFWRFVVLTIFPLKFFTVPLVRSSATRSVNIQPTGARPSLLAVLCTASSCGSSSNFIRFLLLIWKWKNPPFLQWYVMKINITQKNLTFLYIFIICGVCESEIFLCCEISQWLHRRLGLHFTIKPYLSDNLFPKTVLILILHNTKRNFWFDFFLFLQWKCLRNYQKGPFHNLGKAFYNYIHY